MNISRVMRCTIVILIFSMASSGFSQSTTSPIPQKILVQGSNNYPPFEFINDKGQPDGFNVDMFKAIMQITDMPYELRLGEWDAVIDSMYNNKIDVLVGMIFSEERARNVRFCLPHCEVNRNIVCRKNNPYTTLESLAGKEIIVQQGGWSEKYVKANNLTDKVIVVNDMSEALALLESGKHDAAIGSDLVALSNIKNKKYKNLKIHRTTIEPQQYSIVVNHDNEALLRLINMGLQELKVSGEYDKIYNKWFGVYNRSGQISKIIYYSLVLAVTIAIIALLSIRILRKKVRQATRSLAIINTDLQLSLKAGELSAWRYDTESNRIKSLHGETFAQSGITLDELRTMLHPDDSDYLIELFNQIATGIVETGQLIFRLCNSYNGYSWIETEMIAERDPKNFITGIIGTQRDVSRNQQLQQERQEVSLALKMAIRAASLYVWYYDVESNKYFRLRDDQFVASKNTLSSFIRHLHPDDIQLYNTIFERLINGYQDTAEIVLRVFNPRRKEYSYFESCLSAVRDKSGRVYRIAINQRDITKKCIRKLEIQSAYRSLDMAMEAAELLAWDYNIATKKHRILYGQTNYSRKDSNDIEFSYCHPDDVPEYSKRIRKVLAGESDRESITIRKIQDDGQYGYFDTIISSIKNDDGKVINLIGSFKDISRLKAIEMTVSRNNKELKSVNRKNQLILNNINSGLAYINLDYMVEWENISICTTSISFEAYRKGEKCYRSAHNRQTPCDNCVMQRVIKSRCVEKIEFELQDKSTVEVFATPVINEYDQIEGVIIRMDDITERKQIYRDLAEAKDKAERSDRLKSAFLANMSHEIRTPLNAIIGFSELITLSDDKQEKEEYSRIVNINNELLLKLINDILELSKIEAGVMTIKLSRGDLSACFEDIATMMRPRVPQGVELICENPYTGCVVEFDRDRFNQVMTNFLTNAIKFTRDGSITMGCEYLNGTMYFYVKDTGIGIAAEDIHKVFARFEKVDTFAQGTGLGMTICKAIVESIGGEIGLESQLGVGSKFWFSIPITPESILRTEHPQQLKPILNDDQLRLTPKLERRYNVLIAEDNDSNYMLVEAFLKHEFNLTRAINGAKTVELIKGNQYHVVLMDMKMPVMNGMEATQTIRTFNTEVPIVALTAHAFDMDKEAALEVGCNEYLTKPVKRDQLLKLLYKICIK